MLKMSKAYEFSKEQKEFMKNNYLSMTNQELTDYFNDERITKPKVSRWLRKNGCQRGKGYVYDSNCLFSNEDVNFIKDNYLNMSYREIGNILGVTERQVRGKIGTLGLKKYRTICDDYFNVIDTPIKSYFLGYLYADGWVVYNTNKSNYELGIMLQIDDEYILEKLNEELGGQNIISYREPRDIKMSNGQIIHSGKQSCLRVYSKNIVEQLISHGVVPNKTQKEIYPIVDDNLFFDWLRGYIDGDGCFWSMKNNYYMHITCATDKVLYYIKDKLETHNIKTKIYKENDNKYRLMCIDVESMKILINKLYYNENIFCLRRKYELIKYYKGFAIQ